MRNCSRHFLTNAARLCINVVDGYPRTTRSGSPNNGPMASSIAGCARRRVNGTRPKVQLREIEEGVPSMRWGGAHP